MNQTVPDPHPMQGYLDELDALIGQLTTLRYSIAGEILAAQARDRAAAHYGAMAEQAKAESAVTA